MHDADKLLLNRIKSFITRHNLIRPDDSIVVALSGGPDSVALLHILLNLQKRYRLTLRGAMVNYMLRGRESLAEESFVRELCRKSGVDLSVKRINFKRLYPGESVQKKARELRYDFFYHLVSRYGMKKIATGHTMDDRAETFLLNLVRGAGCTGIKSIPPARDIVIRPLLGTKKHELESYCYRNGLRFCVDSSNREKKYLRNIVRLDLIPRLLALNPKFLETTARTCDVLGEEEKFLEEKVEQLMPGITDRVSPDSFVIFLNAFMNLHRAMRRRIIRNIIRKLGGTEVNLEYSKIEKISEIIEKPSPNKELRISENIYFRKEYDRLCFFLSAGKKSRVETEPVEVPIGETVRFGNIRLWSKIRQRSDWNPRLVTDRDSPKQFLDMEKVCFPLFLRYVQRGDRFVPLGMKGEKRIFKLLKDDKVPKHRRSSTVLLCDQKGIIWIVGNRIADRISIDGKTKKILEVEYSDHQEIN